MQAKSIDFDKLLKYYQRNDFNWGHLRAFNQSQHEFEKKVWVCLWSHQSCWQYDCEPYEQTVLTACWIQWFLQHPQGTIIQSNSSWSHCIEDNFSQSSNKTKIWNKQFLTGLKSPVQSSGFSEQNYKDVLLACSHWTYLNNVDLYCQIFMIWAYILQAKATVGPTLNGCLSVPKI